MKKITLISALFVALFTTANAQYTVLATDPAGDAGSMGIDVKTISYMLSADKKDITFKVETNSAVSSWNMSGFVLNFDDDNNAANGDAPEGPNKSMNVDRAVVCMNMSNVWSTSLEVASPKSSTNVTSDVTITNVDPMTTTIKIPVSKIDANNDGKFKMVFETAVAGSTLTYDDVPNTGSSSISTWATGIRELNVVKFNIYPNPACSAVHFSSNDAISGSIGVYDIIGREVAKENINGTNTIVPVSQLANGTYLYRVTNKENELLNTGKLSIQQ